MRQETEREAINEQWERINVMLGTSIVHGDETLVEALKLVADKLELLGVRISNLATMENRLAEIMEKVNGKT